MFRTFLLRTIELNPTDGVSHAISHRLEMTAAVTAAAATYYDPSQQKQQVHEGNQHPLTGQTETAHEMHTSRHSIKSNKVVNSNACFTLWCSCSTGKWFRLHQSAALVQAPAPK